MLSCSLRDWVVGFNYTMGIGDRDYLREEKKRFSSPIGINTSMPPVTKWILISCIVVFVLQIFLVHSHTDEQRVLMEKTGQRFGQMSYVEEWLALDKDSLMKGQVWRLVTYAFCHSRYSTFHLFVNMLLLVGVASVIERRYGSKEFLAFYLIAAVVSALVYLGMNSVMGRNGSALGASGAVMAVFALFTCLNPRAIFQLFFVIPVQARWLLVGLAAYDAWPVLKELSGAGRSSSNVAHTAHLGGLVFGLLYYKLGWSFKGWLPDNWDNGVTGDVAGRPRVKLPKKKGSRKGDTGSFGGPSFGGKLSKLVSKSTDTNQGEGFSQERVDKILDKVSEHGLSSLTDEERSFLEDAGRR